MSKKYQHCYQKDQFMTFSWEIKPSKRAELKNKVIKVGRFIYIEEILFKWAVNARESKYVLGGEILRVKARAIGQHLKQLTLKICCLKMLVKFINLGNVRQITKIN